MRKDQYRTPSDVFGNGEPSAASSMNSGDRTRTPASEGAYSPPTASARLDGGRVLETGCNSGNFIAFAPALPV